MKRITLAVAAAMLAALLAPGAAQASLNLGNGQTVRGDVTIVENTGGTRSNTLCSSSGVDSRIVVTRLSDGAVLLDRTKGGEGSWSTVWVTHGQAFGSYRVVSTATSKNFVCTLSSSTLSDVVVTLDNIAALAYTGATSAGVAFPFTASARLRDGTSSRAIVSRTVTFAIDGTPAGSCTTEASGSCSASLSALVAPGAHTITVSFAGDCCWRAAQTSAALTVTPLPPCSPDPASCLPPAPEPPPCVENDPLACVPGA